jgi:hypothetical protein
MRIRYDKASDVIQAHDIIGKYFMGHTHVCYAVDTGYRRM